MLTLEKVDCINEKIDSTAWKIGNAFLKSILLEVSAYPKPGLVCSKSIGSHKDMDIITFMVSSAEIAPAFYKCAQAGRNHRGKIADLLPAIRKVGVIYEKNLLESTKGVNTQRGILFAAGLMCGAAGYLSQYRDDFQEGNLFIAVSEMVQGIVDRELKNIKQKDLSQLTAGEKLYLKYKATGIRGEVEAGFPSVNHTGLPAFKAALAQCNNLNDCIVHVLIALMSCVDDTTILWRKDIDTLQKVQKWAKEILDMGSVFTKEGMDEIYKMNDSFIENNISPGGSADLVSITIGTYLLINGQFPVNIL